MTKGRVITKFLQRQFVVAVVLCICVCSTATAYASGVQHVVISELKLGGPVNGQLTEYVELFNDSGSPVDLADYSLEYAKYTALLVQPECKNDLWEGPDIRETRLSGIIQPRGRLVFPIALNDNIDGSLRLRDSSGVVVGLVGWGEGSRCYDGTAAVRPPNRSSLKRLFDADGHPVDTLNNQIDFIVSQSPMPEIDYPPELAEEDPLPEEPIQLCQNQVVISEFLPDPYGLESAGGEFVELYNPSATEAALYGCSLRSNKSKTNVMDFSEVDYIPAQGYRVVQLTDKLTNASGTITFATSDREDVVEYVGAKEGQVYALIGEAWQFTYIGTPGALNQVDAASEVLVGGSGSGVAALADCGEGRYRNPETNRCRNMESQEAALSACASDQERNPETNRCRKIASASPLLAPCAVGQFRNPETNRCKKIANGEDGLKPCELGQERNPETNRCRKVASAVSGTPLESTAQPAAISVFKYKTPIIGLLSVFFGGYALYEYRTDARNYIQRFREKRRGRPPG